MEILSSERKESKPVKSRLVRRKYSFSLSESPVVGQETKHVVLRLSLRCPLRFGKISFGKGFSFFVGTVLLLEVLAFLEILEILEIQKSHHSVEKRGGSDHRLETLENQRAQNEGLDPSWLDFAFFGRPDFQSRGLKNL